MRVEAELTDDDLADLTEDDEKDEDEPTAMIYASIGASDGMRWAGSVFRVGAEQMTPEQYAEALVSAVHGAARTHSPDTARALERWLVVPPDLDVQ